MFDGEIKEQYLTKKISFCHLKWEKSRNPYFYLYRLAFQKNTSENQRSLIRKAIMQQRMRIDFDSDYRSFSNHKFPFYLDIIQGRINFSRTENFGGFLRYKF
jgi:transposase-like protein